MYLYFIIRYVRGQYLKKALLLLDKKKQIGVNWINFKKVSYLCYLLYGAIDFNFCTALSTSWNQGLRKFSRK